MSTGIATPHRGIDPLPTASRRGLPWWLPAIIAAAVAILGWLIGWRGVDLPAQVYRVDMFRRFGFSVWDSRWYGGHWTLDYSVIFPPVAGLLGLTATAALSASGAALAFDRLVVEHFGPGGRIGSLLFAIGTTVPIAIGQLPFLMGEALALGAGWAASRRRWPLAAVLSAATALSSPLAGAFLALGLAAWWLAGRSGVGETGRWTPGHWAALVMLAAVAVPMATTTVLFPGQGAFPYPGIDFVVELAVAVALLAIVPKGQRLLRAAAVLYVLATVAAFAISSPVGGNVGRLAESVAIPLGACLLWPRRRVLFVVLAIPMLLLQWTPAWGAMTTNGSDPSTHRAYFRPLVDELSQHAEPLGRVEVIPTRQHWEAAYVAPSIPLARGWERQLDMGDNPLFYQGDLTAAEYHAWLVDNGVRFVALPDATLDFAGRSEARLVEAGVPGLTPAWSNSHWRVFAVSGSSGIVEGPARLTVLDGSRISLDATAAGPVVVRIRYSPHWTVAAGAACISGRSAKAIRVEVRAAGPITLRVRPTTTASDDQSECP